MNHTLHDPIPLTHDKAMARDFLIGLDPNAEKFAFQFVDDSRPNPKYSSVYHATIEQIWPYIEKVNTPIHGLGVAVLPNGFADRQPRAFFAAANNNEQIDSALAAITACGAKANMIVEDSGRLRLCYPCPDIPPGQYATMQK